MSTLRSKKGKKGKYIGKQYSSLGKTLYFSYSNYEKDEIREYRVVLDKIEKDRIKRGKITEDTREALKAYPLLYSRLVKRGFIDAPIAEATQATFEQLRREYLEYQHANGKKPHTIESSKNGIAHLIEFWGTRPAAEFTSNDAAVFAKWLDDRMTENRRRREAGERVRGITKPNSKLWALKKANALMAWANETGRLGSNPLATLEKGAWQPGVIHNLSQEEQQAAFNALERTENADEWCALFALALYQGFRVPSESCLLKWSDIDFNAEVITIHSPKTEGKGYASREMRLFPQTVERLNKLDKRRENVFEATLELQQAGQTNTCLRRILKKAGVPLWPALWDNLRTTCRNSLLYDYGFEQELICEWLGHDAGVDSKHYAKSRRKDWFRK